MLSRSDGTYDIQWFPMQDLQKSLSMMNLDSSQDICVLIRNFQDRISASNIFSYYEIQPLQVSTDTKSYYFIEIGVPHYRIEKFQYLKRSLLQYESMKLIANFKGMWHHEKNYLMHKQYGRTKCSEIRNLRLLTDVGDV